MKFYLHIGSPKAGSSALQGLCANARAALRAAGVHAPEGLPADEQRMRAGEISPGNGKLLADMIWNARWDDVERWISHRAAEAAALDCDRVLVSSEWLLGALAHDDGLIRLSACFERTGNPAPQLLLVLRDPVDQLISHYKHRAKSGFTGSVADWAARDYVLPQRLASIRSQLESAQVELTVRGYRSESGALAQMFFEQWLGLPVPGGEVERRVNPSLTLAELAFLQALQRARPALVPELYDAFIGVSPQEKAAEIALMEPARRSAAAGVVVHAAEWEWWNERLPVDERLAIPAPEDDTATLEAAKPSPQIELSETQSAALMQLLADTATPAGVAGLFWRSRLRPWLARLRQLGRRSGKSTLRRARPRSVST